MKIFAIAGYSGSGKTTLIERLLPEIVGRGLSVSVIKHAHHGFDIDRPGKDSYRHREAGASEVMITSGQRWALLHELRSAPEPTLADYLARLTPCDLVLVEGFKQEPVPKLEIHRVGNGKPPLYPEFPQVVALSSDLPAAEWPPQLRCFPLLSEDPADPNVAAMVDFILARAIAAPLA